jgi:transposase
VVDALAGGASVSQVATRFGLSPRTVTRYRRLQQVGHLAPKPIPGRSPLIRPDHYPLLVATLRAQPTSTLATLCHVWATQTGIPVSQATMSRTITRLGWARKQRPIAPPG